MSEIRLISSKRLAELKGFSHSHMRNRLRLGQIQGAVKVGRDWVISVEGGLIDAQKLPTAKIVASKVGLSHSHFRRLLRENKVKGSKVARDWIISDLEQMEYKRQRRKREKGR